MNDHTNLFDFLTNYSHSGTGRLEYGLRDGIVYWLYEDKPIPDGIAEGYIENLGMIALQQDNMHTICAEQEIRPEHRQPRDLYTSLSGYGDAGWMTPKFFCTPGGQKIRRFETRAAAILFLLDKRYRYLYPQQYLAESSS